MTAAVPAQSADTESRAVGTLLSTHVDELFELLRGLSGSKEKELRIHEVVLASESSPPAELRLVRQLPSADDTPQRTRRSAAFAPDFSIYLGQHDES